MHRGQTVGIASSGTEACVHAFPGPSAVQAVRTTRGHLSTIGCDAARWLAQPLGVQKEAFRKSPPLDSSNHFRKWAWSPSIFAQAAPNGAAGKLLATHRAVCHLQGCAAKGHFHSLRWRIGSWPSQWADGWHSTLGHRFLRACMSRALCCSGTSGRTQGRQVVGTAALGRRVLSQVCPP
jgi:hypothetical protein